MPMQSLKEKVRTKWMLSTQTVRARMNDFLTRTPPTDFESEVIHDLETEGVHVTSLDKLIPGRAEQILNKASQYIREHQNPESAPLWKSSVASKDLIPQKLLEELPELFLLGLEDKLLSLVQRYIRLPLAYHGAVLRHSAVNGENVGTRLWHLDAEDFHVFRMLIYLNDVHPGGGPFEYIPRRVGDTIRRPVSVAGGMINNEQMGTILPEDKWKQCTGPMGTVILCDAAQVYHHESRQKERERFVIMSGYSSHRPRNRTLSMAHFPVEEVATQLSKLVPAEKRRIVFGWRG